MPRRYVFFLTGVALFFLFVFFSYLVHKNIFMHTDFDMTVRLQDNISRRFDELFSFFSIVGNAEVMGVILLVLVILLRKVFTGIVLLGSFVIFHLFELYGKIFVNHPPPPEFMLRTHYPFQFPAFTVREEFSYPSGHSGRTTFVCIVALFLLWKSKRLPLTAKWVLTVLLGAFAVTMYVSRIYLGEHWTTDVIGGILLAGGLALLGLATVPNKHLPKV